MTLTKIVQPKFELIDIKDEMKCELNETYIFRIEGYSVLSDIGFIKFEIGYGNCLDDAIFFAYNEIKNNLLLNYNIIVNEMKVDDYKLCDANTQSPGFIFHPLTDEIIQEFREDEERYFMSLEDKSCYDYNIVSS